MCREAVLDRRLSDSLLPGPWGRRDLQREGRGHLAALDSTLERGFEPLEELEPPPQPGPRATERGLDLGRGVALVKEVADRTRLFERADTSPRGVEDQATPTGPPRVEVVHADESACPAEVGQGPKPQDPVHQLETAVLTATHVEGTLQAHDANARSQLGLPPLVAEDGALRRYESTESDFEHGGQESIPSWARI